MKCSVKKTSEDYKGSPIGDCNRVYNLCFVFDYLEVKFQVDKYSIIVAGPGVKKADNESFKVYLLTW